MLEFFCIFFSGKYFRNLYQKLKPQCLYKSLSFLSRNQSYLCWLCHLCLLLKLDVLADFFFVLSVFADFYSFERQIFLTRIVDNGTLSCRCCVGTIDNQLLICMPYSLLILLNQWIVKILTFWIKLVSWKYSQ